MKFSKTETVWLKILSFLYVSACTPVPEIVLRVRVPAQQPSAQPQAETALATNIVVKRPSVSPAPNSPQAEIAETVVPLAPEEVPESLSGPSALPLPSSSPALPTNPVPASSPSLSSTSGSTLSTSPSPTPRPTPTPSPTPLPATYTNSLGITFRRVEPGSFTMGSPVDESGRHDDETAHLVTLTRPYYLSVTEITQTQWLAVMPDNPSAFVGPQHPVDSVDWEKVQAFLAALNQRQEGLYRLPTEAEWEYAARAGSQERFYAACGQIESCLDNLAWYAKNSGNQTQPVAQKFPNAWGFYDMIGNVWEWTQDFYAPFDTHSHTDPQGPLSGPYRVYRGGSFGQTATNSRVANRPAEGPILERINRMGLRLVYMP